MVSYRIEDSETLSFPYALTDGESGDEAIQTDVLEGTAPIRTVKRRKYR